MSPLGGLRTVRRLHVRPEVAPASRRRPHERDQGSARRDPGWAALLTGADPFGGDYLAAYQAGELD